MKRERFPVRTPHTRVSHPFRDRGGARRQGWEDRPRPGRFATGRPRPCAAPVARGRGFLLARVRSYAPQADHADGRPQDKGRDGKQ